MRNNLDFLSRDILSMKLDSYLFALLSFSTTICMKRLPFFLFPLSISRKSSSSEAPLVNHPWLPHTTVFLSPVVHTLTLTPTPRRVHAHPHPNSMKIHRPSLFSKPKENSRHESNTNANTFQERHNPAYQQTHCIEHKSERY